MSKSILILGGTFEGAALAHAIAQHRAELFVTLALAGATSTPPEDTPAHLHVGAFESADALADYIRMRHIAAVIDATHPFAAEITKHAVTACDREKIPYLRFDRPQWTLPPDTDVVYVPDAEEAARLVARTSGGAFLTIGRKALAHFANLGDVKLVARTIDAPDAIAGLENCVFIQGRPPFSVDDEEALMRRHGIDTLVSKASGGDLTRAKIDAAARVGARIVLIRRPPPPDADIARSLDDAMGWLYVHV
ncbi:MAG: cobalt-precorrin-6A reductase [Alphaproteobacteria bacterium]|nr:cobalt-precorrin-6A reductase [Alphaproteobacteria bacterium]